MATLNDRLKNAAQVLMTTLVKNCPKDTWNLARNGIWIVQEEGNYYVCVGGENARYAIYTNEPWVEGNNPNEGWIEHSIEEALPLISSCIQGDITQEEIDQYLNDAEAEIGRQQAERVKEILQGGRI